MSTTPPILTPGNTVHLIRGSKSGGVWTLKSVGEPDENGWIAISDVNGCQWFTRTEDAFATAEEAKAAAKARRKPRQPKQARPLYGDFAQLAAFSGISTDGTGRKVAR